MRDLVGGPRRFVELQRVLPGISTEQLRSRLNRMVADGMLTRQRYREVPPRVDYELTDRARDLMPVLAALARWGYRWTWGAPRPGEAVDIGAILRLAPGILELSRSTSGTIACTVRDGGRAGHYLLTIKRGSVQIDDRTSSPASVAPADDEPSADAQIVGAEPAWIAALGPDSRRGQLQISGDRALAGALLDGLAAHAATVADAA